MHSVIRILLLIILALVSGAGTALSQPASGSPAKSTPTPIPLSKLPLEAQSTLAYLQEIEANVSRDQSSAEAIGSTLSGLINEIDTRIAEDRRLLTSSPTLEVLFPLKLAWQSFRVRLSVTAGDLTQHATSLEEQLGRLNKLDQSWQVTLQSARQPETPPPVLQSAQSIVDSIERTRQAIESGQTRVLALQSRISEQEARVRTALSSIEEGENRALKNLFVRDSRPIWGLKTSLGTEWESQSAESFSLQLKSSQLQRRCGNFSTSSVDRSL
jgi:potassium-dependent mechanosensitive channel